MTILVTGGAGFIGSHTVDRLVANGEGVRVLDNLSTGKRANLQQAGAGVEFVHGDIRDAVTVDTCVRGVTAIVHLAAVASVPASLDDPVGTHQSNFDGTLNLLEAARLHGVSRFVYASSAAIYGDTVKLPVPESEVPHPLSPYAADKLAGEYYLSYYAVKYGIKTAAFRFFNIYGPRQDPSSPYSGVISIFVDRARKAAPVTIHGDGQQTRDFVFVGDVVDILMRSLQLELPAGRVINLGTGNGSSLLDLLTAIGATAGKPMARNFAPVRTGDIRHSRADVTRLREHFGTVPGTPLEAGLQRLWESMT